MVVEICEVKVLEWDALLVNIVGNWGEGMTSSPSVLSAMPSGRLWNSSWSNLPPTSGTGSPWIGCRFWYLRSYCLAINSWENVHAVSRRQQKKWRIKGDEQSATLPTSSGKEEYVCFPHRSTSHCSQQFSLQHKKLSTFNQFSTANGNFNTFYIFHASRQNQLHKATCSTVSTSSQHSTSRACKLRRAKNSHELLFYSQSNRS